MAYAADQLPSGLDAKTTPVDADVVPVGDSADSNRARKVTWANIKATLKTYFDTLYATTAQANATHTGEVTGATALTIDKTAITGKTAVTAVGADYVLISDTSDSGNLKKALASDLTGAGGAVEGTAVLSTGEVGGVKYLREDGDGTCSWQVPAGSGNVSKVGTPVDNQVGVWTGDGTIEGDTALTFDTATDKLSTGALNLSGLTASEIVATDGSKNLQSLAVATYPSLTELSYVKGLSSAVQTQINAKAPTASPSFTGTVTLPTGLTGVIRADSGVVSVDTDVTDIVSAASDTTAGKVELATIAETNTGTDAARAVTPDGLAGSNFGIRYVPVALNGSTALAATELFYFRVPAGLNGMNLVSVSATVGTGAAGASSSGTPTFTVKNVTDGNQMLSTSLTVDANEYTSATAATAAAINTSFDDVVTDDLIEVKCTVAGTGTTYAVVTLGFALP